MDQVETSHRSSSWRAPAVSPSTVTDPETGSELICGPPALEQRRQRTREHLTKIAPRREDWLTNNRYYYELLARLLRFLVEPRKRVLSVRCGTGNLLAAVRPSDGKGIDICAEIVEIAQQRNPSLNFVCSPCFCGPGSRLGELFRLRPQSRSACHPLGETIRVIYPNVLAEFPATAVPCPHPP
jgi:SAM-dependent methyltransferase